MQFIYKDNRKLDYPIFFPDATRAVLRSVDSDDIANSGVEGVLVNTYHLWDGLGKKIEKFGGVSGFMNYGGPVISDSGGFQVMSIVKKAGGETIDDGVSFKKNGKKVLFTPEMSIAYQFSLDTDLMVVLDDFTPPGASKRMARATVERTLRWAERSKKEYERQRRRTGKKPYLIAVVQGGEFLELRKKCLDALVSIGFDGLGYGGWPLNNSGKFNYEVAELISSFAPENYILYGLGVGKPEDVAGCAQLGFHVFDCVLPTRDARHKRLYVYTGKQIEEINLEKDFYEFYYAGKERDLKIDKPVSEICDCLLCRKYSKGYLAHLFRIGDSLAFRLATIHNLRFYSILMEKLKG